MRRAYEYLDWLANNPRYTARYALDVGAPCRKMTVKDVARTERLHHTAVKGLDKLYMAEPLRRNRMPSTGAIGVDEISIRKGRDYRVVVSDLERRRPIWFGGSGRKQEDLALFFEAFGERRTARLRLAVMDMWKPFRLAAVLRELEGEPEMAAPEALREIRRHDRTALGWHRCVLQAGE